ncbi:hypothetical protein CL659_00755 [bacterium]|nr:hypothetical protein [bacterium]
MTKKELSPFFANQATGLQQDFPTGEITLKDLAERIGKDLAMTDSAIGKLGRKIRYWVVEGLLPKPKRSRSGGYGHKHYSLAKLILKRQDQGFSNKEVKMQMKREFPEHYKDERELAKTDMMIMEAPNPKKMRSMDVYERRDHTPRHERSIPPPPPWRRRRPYDWDRDDYRMRRFHLGDGCYIEVPTWLFERMRGRKLRLFRNIFSEFTRNIREEWEDGRPYGVDY